MLSGLPRRLLVTPFEDPLQRLLEREVVGSCATLLDVGCGHQSPVRGLAGRVDRMVGVDLFAPYMERSRAARIHTEYHMVDALDIESRFGARSFDCVVALDLIEHLDKADGQRLLGVMERVARRKVIVFTPNGFVPQRAYDDNPYQAHRSGWTADEMRGAGYRLWGVNGWKPLRGERAEPRWRPRRMWATMALWSQPFVERHADHAFHLLCIKDLVATAPSRADPAVAT
jgi:hypothetical protein